MAFLLFAPAPMRAQDSSSQQPQQDQSAQQNNPNRVSVLRQAQERVRARRQQRIQQIIQDTYSHKYEVYFGGGYQRFRPGNTLQHVNESGWNVGITDYIHGNLGVAADFRGYYGTTYTGTNPGAQEFHIFAPSISQYTFMAGPQYRFYRGLHWGWTGQVLAGVGHGNFGTGTGGLPPTLIGLYPDGNVVNVTAGASVDYNLGPGLAIRLTPNYLLTDYGSTLQHNAGFEMGVVYRFGRR
ncbi:hypothetical protein [Paracidobacterium acidisoli]|uniref:Outer membrane protein beta-barrel domain-containing protein n=1 Tax=Paracidobacterium acidisoli TaxID=2303751 RepID=A0A372IPT2_9BACT|nr:hypothetical protein [Paracidobacterium acidisoli]MBT9331206.1 hypothetical protein [Paracidobacterium acidisoli]